MISHKHVARLSVISFVLVVVGACTQAEQPRTCGGPRLVPGSSPEWQDATIEIAGGVLATPMILTAEELRTMAWTTLHDVHMQRSHAPSRLTSWRGPALADVFAAANVPAGELQATLVAPDGYSITISRSRLESAIIAFEDGDGRPLIDKEGYRWRLVVPGATGNYWIVNLAKIVLEPAAAE